MITNFHKNLFCLIVTLPFYVHATDSTEHKHPVADWTFTIKRTSQEAIPEWQTLLALYGAAAQKLFSKEELENILKDLHGLPLPEINPTDPKEVVNETTLQPFLGQRLTTLAYMIRDNGIHGNLTIQFNSPDALEASVLTWALELLIDKEYSRDDVDTLIKELRELTCELNENSCTSDDIHFGSLLHGVAQQSVAGAPYTCHASLALHT